MLSFDLEHYFTHFLKLYLYNCQSVRGRKREKKGGKEGGKERDDIQAVSLLPPKSTSNK